MGLWYNYEWEANMKRLFIGLSIVGFIIICILSFVLPKNPFEIIPAMTMVSFDKPVWLCGIIGGGFVYLMILWGIYDKLSQSKN